MLESRSECWCVVGSRSECWCVLESRSEFKSGHMISLILSE